MRTTVIPVTFDRDSNTGGPSVHGRAGAATGAPLLQPQGVSPTRRHSRAPKRAASLLCVAIGWALAVVLALMPVVAAAGVSMIHLDETFQSASDLQLNYIEDKEGRLGLTDILAKSPSSWRQSGSDGLNIGYTRSAYWVSLEIENRSGAAMRLMMNIAYPMLDSITVHLLKNGELERQFVLGDNRVFSQRLIDHTDFLGAPAGQHPHLDRGRQHHQPEIVPENDRNVRIQG